ncbi:MAG: hypothetical protein ACRDJ4_07565 [Actinomycetota bacterium]
MLVAGLLAALMVVVLAALIFFAVTTLKTIKTLGQTVASLQKELMPMAESLAGDGARLADRAANLGKKEGETE